MSSISITPFGRKLLMPCTFIYLRVSTTGQTTDNQLQEIKAAGFKVEPRRVVPETVSGNVATSQRRGFTRLLDRLEPGDVLVVTKLDRLGRNVMDVGSTVAKLAELGVRVHCLALGGVDLTSSSISAHKRETWLLEMPDAPMALPRSSAASVEIP
jgi:putative DNA-invertase from lambdoid prophage Rac